MTLIVEGTSEVAYFIALDRKLTELTVRRDAYSHAHELTHQALVDIKVGNNATGMAALNDVLALLARDDGSKASGAFLPHGSMVGVESTDTSLRPGARSDRDLPPWRSQTFVGLAGPTWFSSGNAPKTSVAFSLTTPDFGLAHRESPWLTFRPPVDGSQLLVDIRVALIRLMRILSRVVRRFKRAIRATRRLRLVVRNGLKHRPDTLALVLVILAACRRYGRRSEPDDHASLLNRRHVVIMGSCLQT